MQTARFSLPQLVVSQAQKEITHNEALLRIDALLHPAVESISVTPPGTLLAADSGKCWLIGVAATGLWQGHDAQIAYWTGGDWRFVVPLEGISVLCKMPYGKIIFNNNQWVIPASIAAVSGGTTIDVEARAQLAALLGHLATIGIVA